MTRARVAELNDFASEKHPGHVGVEILSCEPAEVTGQLVHVGRTTQVWDVEVRNQTRNRLIALFRATQMIFYR